MRMRGLSTSLAALAVAAACAGAWAGETDAYLQGLSPSDRAEFPSALQRMVSRTSHDVLGGVPVRNHAYSVYLLHQAVDRRIEAKEFELSRRQIAGAKAALRDRLIKETQDFLEDLEPEVARLARESSTPEEFASKLNAIDRGVGLWAGAKAVAVAEPGKLAPTEANIEGPFYRPNAPFSDRLFEGAKPEGDLLLIRGRVLDVEGRPLANALVDVWQADSKGAYDIADPNDRNNPGIAYNFRARMLTDAQGNYHFTTILPGNYEYDEHKWRCRHVHYKVSASGFKALTTQLYFDGDPFNATDPWWKASTSVPLTAADGAKRGVFDVVLGKS